MEVAAEAAGAGLRSFLAEAGSYLRAAALDSRFALDSLWLLDLAECLDSALPDCLQADQGSNESGGRQQHFSAFHPLCAAVKLLLPSSIAEQALPDCLQLQQQAASKQCSGLSVCV